MNLSNYEKYSLSKEEVLRAKGDIINLVNIERLKNMTNEFDLVSFFESKSKIAVILITPKQVVISYGSYLIDHNSLYSHMANCVSKQKLRNPMIELRCVSKENNKFCYLVFHSKSTILPEMKKVLIKIHSQFSKIEKDIILFNMEEFENQINESKLPKIKQIYSENIIGFSLLDYLSQLKTEKNLIYTLYSHSKN